MSDACLRNLYQKEVKGLIKKYGGPNMKERTMESDSKKTEYF